MIRRPPRSTLDRSSAASDVYKRQELESAKKAVEIAKKQENKAKNKLETSIKNGIKINS